MEPNNQPNNQPSILPVETHQLPAFFLFILPKILRNQIPKGEIYREDVVKAAILGFFFGWLGVHSFRTRRVWIGFGQFLLSGVTITLMVFSLIFGYSLQLLMGKESANSVDPLALVKGIAIYIPLIAAYAWGVIDSIYLLIVKDRYPSKEDAKKA